MRGMSSLPATLLIVMGFLFISYGFLIIGVSTLFPMTITIPVPWSDKPVTVDNPQLEPGIMLVILGIVLVFVGNRMAAAQLSIFRHR